MATFPAIGDHIGFLETRQVGGHIWPPDPGKVLTSVHPIPTLAKQPDTGIVTAHRTGKGPTVTQKNAALGWRGVFIWACAQAVAAANA